MPSRLRRLIPFDHWGEHPMYFVGFAPTRARDATALEVRETKAWVSVPEFGIVDVRSHVRERYAGIHREGEPVTIDLDAPLRDGERAPGVRVLAPRAPAERRVEHPKLGPGRVVREVDGAWVVAFDSGETKTIVPRFLRLL
ncbi:MAG: hypothetical protein K1X94_27575 [Sandaracinaceae bacterium]|nr:hypothetical protein [Sandaracinaceae bacterium]